MSKQVDSQNAKSLLPLAHSANFMKLPFVVVSHKIFLLRLIIVPLSAAPLDNCHPALLSYATGLSQFVLWLFVILYTKLKERAMLLQKH